MFTRLTDDRTGDSHSCLFSSNTTQLCTQHWDSLARSGNIPCAPTTNGRRDHMQSCSHPEGSPSTCIARPLKLTALQHLVPANPSWELLYHQLKSLLLGFVLFRFFLKTSCPLSTTSYSSLLPSLYGKTSLKCYINSLVLFPHTLLTPRPTPTAY